MPIVVLGCKHSFAAESLDGLVGIDEMYIIDTALSYFPYGLLSIHRIVGLVVIDRIRGVNAIR